jgi:hypothetical protein
MSEVPHPPRPGGSDYAEREARRALLQDALTELAGAADPDRAADDVLRALDGYLGAGSPTPLAPREPPVADFRLERADRNDAKIVTWLVIGGAVIATCIVAVMLNGGWPAGVAVIAIWAAALLALLST